MSCDERGPELRGRKLRGSELRVREPRSCHVRRCREFKGQTFAVSLMALLAGGCAHGSQSPYAETSSYAGGPRQTAAAVPIPVEMEDDGRPAQLPPRANAEPVQDDPHEPWSPNYGGPNTTITAQKPTSLTRASQKVADASE